MEQALILSAIPPINPHSEPSEVSDPLTDTKSYHFLTLDYTTKTSADRTALLLRHLMKEESYSYLQAVREIELKVQVIWVEHPELVDKLLETIPSGNIQIIKWEPRLWLPIFPSVVKTLDERHPTCRLHYTLPLWWSESIVGSRPSGSFSLDGILNSSTLYSLQARTDYG